MGDPRRLLPHEVEILATRELRKAGLALSALRERSRARLSRRGGEEFAVELTGALTLGGVEHRLLVECRSELHPVRAEAVHALHAKLGAPDAEDAPRRLVAPSHAREGSATPAPPPLRYAIMFSTSGYEPESVRAARALGVPLLAVTDGRAAFVRSGYGVAGEPPSWVPEYMTELVDLDDAGAPRYTLVAADRPELILGQLH